MADESIPQLRPVVTRAEAKHLGLIRYFTGKPCKHGHTAERVTVNGYCVICRDAAISAFCAAHKDERNEDRRRRRSENPEPYRLQKRRQRLRDVKQFRERDQENYRRFRDKIIRRSAEWQKNNPDKVRAREALRRARKLLAGGRHTEADIRRLFKGQKGLCAYCDMPLSKGYHVDHFIPLSRGGSNGPDNLRLACGSCNNRKYNKDPMQFLCEIDQKQHATKLRLTNGNIGGVGNKRAR